MPIGKKIHELLSKRHDRRNKRMKELEKVQMRNGPVPPPTVEQYKKNQVARAKSVNVHIVNLSGPRQLSPNEGMPSINGESGQRIVDKGVTKIKSKIPQLSAKSGAIIPVQVGDGKFTSAVGGNKRKCTNCDKPGHTKRTCPEGEGKNVEQKRARINKGGASGSGDSERKGPRRIATGGKKAAGDKIS